MRSLFLYLTILLFFGSNSYAQKCFYSFSINDPVVAYSPLYGLQLPDSSYRILCKQKTSTIDLYKLYVVDLDKEGRFFSAQKISVEGFANLTVEYGDVTSDERGNIYFYFNSDMSVVDSFYGAIVKVSLDKKISVLGYTTNSVSRGKCIVNAGSNRLVAGFKETTIFGSAFEIMDTTGTTLSVSKYFPYAFFNPIGYLKDGHFLLSRYENDSFTVYLSDSIGNILKTIRRCIYPAGGNIGQNVKELKAGKVQFINVDDEHIYLTYTTYLPDIGYYRPHLVKANKNLNVLWDKPIGDTLAGGAKYIVQPLENGDFLMVNGNWYNKFSPYTGRGGKGGAIFTYLDSNGNIFNQFDVSTRPYGWVVNDSMSSIASFDVINSFKCLDGGIAIFLNFGFEVESYKGSYVLFKTNNIGQICLNPPGPFTSVRENFDVFNINIYPNPNNTNALYINFPEQFSSIENMEITFYNAMGQQVKFLKGNSQEFKEVDIEQLPNGCFVVEVKGEGIGIFHTKLLKSVR